MTLPLYEYLEKTELVPASLGAKVNRWTSTQLLSVCEELTKLLPHSDNTKLSTFDFISSASLSGSPEPCSATKCRLDKAHSLAQFAALYADSVLVPDPFERIREQHEHNLSEVHLDVTTYITILHELRPLIESGQIKFVGSEHLHICSSCYAQIIGKSENQFRKNLDVITEYLDTLYLKKVTYTARRNQFGIHVEAKGPAFLLEHRAGLVELESKYLDAKLGGKKSYQLSSAEVKKEKLHAGMVSPILDDLLLQNLFSHKYGCNYLTGREIDLSLMRKVNSVSASQLDIVISDAFKHSLPIVQNANAKALLELRKNEGEAFRVYRDALTKALQAARSTEAPRMRQVFNDIVRPELAKIELRVRNSKKLLKEKIRQDAIFASGFVAIGVFSGLLPPNIGQIITALGGFKYTSSLLDKMNQLLKEPPQIRDEKFYFLWKAHRIRR